MDPYVDQHRPLAVTIPVEQSTSFTTISDTAQGQETDSDVWAMPRKCTGGEDTCQCSNCRMRRKKCTGEDTCQCNRCRMRRKKCKKRGVSSMAYATPSTADFHVTVAQNTGFSPLSPTAPLQDVFNATMSTTREKSTLRKEVANEGTFSPTHQANPLLATHAEPPSTSPVENQPFTISSPSVSTPTHSTPSAVSRIRCELFLLGQSLAETRPSAFPSPSISTPAPLPTFEELRPQLFQRAFVDSVNGVKFDDTHIYVYSARTRSGVAHKPLAVHARSAFLNAASSTFEQGA